LVVCAPKMLRTVLKSADFEKRNIIIGGTAVLTPCNGMSVAARDSTKMDTGKRSRPWLLFLNLFPTISLLKDHTKSTDDSFLSEATL
jgi:hypothetical protein